MSPEAERGAEAAAEGRRLLTELAAARETIDGDRVEDAKEAWVNFTYQHHDVLLAGPAPVGLTEAAAPTPLSDAERTVMEGVMRGDSTRITHTEALLALALHRLSAAPVDDREARWRRFHPSEVGAVPVSPSVDPEEKP